MDSVSIQPSGNMGKGFIGAEYLGPGKDEYYLRNIQVSGSSKEWRNLKADEVEQFIENGNTSDNWKDVLVTDEFDAGQIKNSEFFGLVRIGRLRNVILEHHDMQMPCGITNSRIISCDIGDDAAIHDVRYLAHYIVGDRCILSNIDEMYTTCCAKFGNGIIKEGEPEESRIWIDLMNEAGCRSVLAFEGMIAADAYLWAKYRDDESLMEKLKEITQNKFDARRGYYGTVGDQCVIKSCRIIKDVKVGAHCYIKGANKLKNLTINSSEQERSEIGEGVELVNGIIGFGCHVFFGSKALRFVMGNNSNLKFDAKLFNTFLGDNSTISCCEVQKSLIFGSHEQHHNNSFLIASMVMGQSNIAAGATIGSNHNSRANDNEVHAGRGFWPGLCTSIKHPSRFASFTLLATGAYRAELDISLPFSLLNNNESEDRLEIMPGYWWNYNMYALSRNSWKFRDRDKRISKDQNIEFDFLAPDTVEEIFFARRLLEVWTGKASLRQAGQCENDKTGEDLAKVGRELFLGPQEKLDGLEILGAELERSKRKVIILKAYKGYHGYLEMLHYYAVRNLVDFLQGDPQADLGSMNETLKGARRDDWVNMGGQLVPAGDVDQIRADVGSGGLSSWEDIHKRYDELWKAYPLEKQKHAFATLCELLGVTELDKDNWLDALNKAVTIQEYIRDQVHASRKKDFDNPFIQATYRNAEEMAAAIGTIDDNSFVKQVRGETEEFKQTVGKLIKAV